MWFSSQSNPYLFIYFIFCPSRCAGCLCWRVSLTLWGPANHQSDGHHLRDINLSYGCECGFQFMLILDNKKVDHGDFYPQTVVICLTCSSAQYYLDFILCSDKQFQKLIKIFRKLLMPRFMKCPLCVQQLSQKPLFVPGVWGPCLSAMVPELWLNEGGQSATGRLVRLPVGWDGTCGVCSLQLRRMCQRVFQLCSSKRILHCQ